MDVTRLIRWLIFKPFGCGCGRAYRNEEALTKCVWKHALEPGVLD